MTGRILYANNTAPAHGGGGDRRILKEAAELADQGLDVKIIAGRTNPELPRTRVIDGVTIRTVKCIPDTLSRFETLYFYLTRMLFPLLSVPALVGECRRREPDIIVDDFTPHPSLAGVVAAVFSLPVIAMIHEFHDRTALQKHPLPIGVIQLIVQNVLRTSLYDAAVVPRGVTRDQLQKYGVPIPIHIVPNGIAVSKYEHPPNNVSVETYDLAVVSRLVHRKGLDLLLDAMSHVVTEQPETKLAIAGSGPRRNALEQMVRNRGLQGNVDFLGYVSEEKKIALLHSVKVFVLPSRQEGFGIAVLEAMATGTPVVVNDLTVLRELLPEKGAKFVDATESGEFGTALLSMIRLPEDQREALGEANRHRAIEYSWAAVATESREVYEAYSRTPLA